MTTRKTAITALGIALYAALSMTLKIPLISHIALDLGYIALAIYAYIFGPAIAAIVGALGCTIISLLTTGWFPPGWFLGNIVIGYVCGRWYKEDKIVCNCVISVAAVFIGILCIKTGVECAMFSIPLVVKLPKNAIAALVDAIVMCIGVYIAPKIKTLAESKGVLD